MALCRRGLLVKVRLGKSSFKFSALDIVHCLMSQGCVLFILFYYFYFWELEKGSRINLFDSSGFSFSRYEVHEELKTVSFLLDSISERVQKRSVDDDKPENSEISEGDKFLEMTVVADKHFLRLHGDKASRYLLMILHLVRTLKNYFSGNWYRKRNTHIF